MSVILRAEAVRRSYNSREVLRIDRLEVGSGETLCLMGPNGAGKSTLVRILNLVEEPDTGTVWFEGNKAGTRSRGARRRMAGVFQRPYMFAGSVTENVAYGLRLRRTPRAEIGRRVETALAELGLSHLAGQEARRLSGGEAQRVALARAIVVEPDVLFLDEPASFLDQDARQDFYRDLHRIVSRGRATVVYVTHSPEEALAVAGRVAVLEDGVIKQLGTAAEVVWSITGSSIPSAFSKTFVIPAEAERRAGIQDTTG